MSLKQASLLEYGVLVTAIAQETRPSRDLNPAQLTAVIVKLDPSTYERCCICNHQIVLPFCLEYLDSEGNLILWGNVCQQCENKVMAEKGDF